MGTKNTENIFYSFLSLKKCLGRGEGIKKSTTQFLKNLNRIQAFLLFLSNFQVSRYYVKMLPISDIRKIFIFVFKCCFVLFNMCCEYMLLLNSSSLSTILVTEKNEEKKKELNIFFPGGFFREID